MEIRAPRDTGTDCNGQTSWSVAVQIIQRMIIVESENLKPVRTPRIDDLKGCKAHMMQAPERCLGAAVGWSRLRNFRAGWKARRKISSAYFSLARRARSCMMRWLRPTTANTRSFPLAAPESSFTWWRFRNSLSLRAMRLVYESLRSGCILPPVFKGWLHSNRSRHRNTNGPAGCW